MKKSGTDKTNKLGIGKTKNTAIEMPNKIRGGAPTPIEPLSKKIVTATIYFSVVFIVAFMFDRISKGQTEYSPKTLLVAFTVLFLLSGILLFLFGNTDIDGIGSAVPNVFFQGIPFSSRIIYAIVTILVFVMAIYFSTVSYYLMVGVLFLIVIVGLAIILNIFYANLAHSVKNTWFKFLIEFIFFIPCLLNIFMAWGLK